MVQANIDRLEKKVEAENKLYDEALKKAERQIEDLIEPEAFKDDNSSTNTEEDELPVNDKLNEKEENADAGAD
jgi:hypothetical protein